MKKIIVCGSRVFSDYPLLDRELKRLTRRLKNFIILSGHAQGADLLAERWAFEQGITYRVFKPDYDTHGKSAPLVRNIEMLKEADYLVAFWNKVSSGTKHIINEATKYNVQTRVIYFEDEK